MPRSLEPLLALDDLLKLLVALILLSVLVVLLQSDSTVGAVRRAVNNLAALPPLLIADLLSGIEMILTSGRARLIFAIMQGTALGVVGCIRKTIQHANVSVRTHKVLFAVYRTTLQYAVAAQLLDGRIKRIFIILQAVLSIVCDAGIGSIRVARAGRSISDDALSICNFILHSSICVTTPLCVVFRSFGNLVHTMITKLHKHFKRSAAYASFSDSLLSIPDVVSNKLCSVWTGLCDGLSHKLEAAVELIFGDGQAMRNLSAELTDQSPSRMLSASRDVVPASDSNYQSPWKGRLRARTSSAQSPKQ